MNRPLVQDWVWESTIGSKLGVGIDYWFKRGCKSRPLDGSTIPSDQVTNGRTILGF